MGVPSSYVPTEYIDFSCNQQFKKEKVSSFFLRFSCFKSLVYPRVKVFKCLFFTLRLRSSYASLESLIQLLCIGEKTERELDPHL